MLPGLNLTGVEEKIEAKYEPPAVRNQTESL